MSHILLLVVILTVNCVFAQHIARQKCAEYVARAKAQQDAPQCKPLSGQYNVTQNVRDFPANVLIEFSPGDNDTLYVCDGVVISDDTVLTSADCMIAGGIANALGILLMSLLSNKKPTVSTWVRLGNDTDFLADVLIDTVIPASNTSNTEYTSNIALVKLKQKLNSTIIPACLDTEGVKETDILVGVGRVSFNQSAVDTSDEPDTTRGPIKGQLKMVPVKKCEDKYRRYLSEKNETNFSRTDEILCTEDPTNGIGNCLFTGSPLYIDNQNCSFKVAGVAWFGPGCGPGSPFTRVSSYISWIENNTWVGDNK